MTFFLRALGCALLLGLASSAATPRKPPAEHGHKAAATHKATAGAGKATAKPSLRSKAKAASKGARTRVPRTLRTVPVSPVVRENAVDRVQGNLTATAASPFFYPSALVPFFRALSAEQAERTADAAPASTVRILQYGDSHTAADIFTGAMRARLQAQFGDGGLGFQFPGHPFAGYHLAGSLRSQSTGWVTEGNRFTALGDGDLGMGGISIATSEPGQTTTLETTCTSLQLHFLQQPGGGRVQFTDNGTALAVIDTVGEGSTPTAGTFSFSCPAGPHAFTFTTLDRAPVKLLGIVTEQPGVTYECLGINGAVAPLILRWNQTLFADYLRQREPSLIVLAYGTNEAGSSAEHLTGYPGDFARILDTLKRNAPDAAVLVLGPPDRAMSSRPGRGRRAFTSWHAFAGTERIIAMQKEACRTHGCAFWDIRRRMGGLGSMQQWVAAGWAQPDRTHLTGTGYRALADALYDDLIRAYNSYQQVPRPAAEESRDGKSRPSP